MQGFWVLRGACSYPPANPVNELQVVDAAAPAEAWDSLSTPDLLLAQIAAGDHEAFETLYRVAFRPLRRICLRILIDPSDADDALQEVFTSVWRRAAQFDSTRSGGMHWLRMLARCKAIDHLRASRPARLHVELDAASDISDPSMSLPQHVDLLMFRIRLERCVEELDPKTENLMRLALFSELTQAELALELKLPLGSIKSRMRRALTHIRTCLDDVKVAGYADPFS